MEAPSGSPGDLSSLPASLPAPEHVLSQGTALSGNGSSIFQPLCPSSAFLQHVPRTGGLPVPAPARCCSPLGLQLGAVQEPPEHTAVLLRHLHSILRPPDQPCRQRSGQPALGIPLALWCVYTVIFSNHESSCLIYPF